MKKLSSEPVQVGDALPEHDLSAAVRQEQVRLAYANLPVSQAVALLNAGLLGYVLSFAVPAASVFAWFVAMAAVTLARLGFAVRYRRASASERQAAGWGHYLVAGALASGIGWGAAAIFLYPPDSVVHQVFLAFVLGGMVVGAVAALTPVFPALLLFCLFTLLPLVVRYLLHGDYLHNAMAAMAAIFLAAMLALGRHIHRTTAETLRLRFENRDLISYLARSRESLVTANANLLAVHEKLRKANEALERRVAERTAALQEADRRKDEFLAVLSHELRNPLAPIRNAVYILNRSGAVSEQAQRARDIIERQTQHIARLVDDLLDVTRIARGKIELRREHADLAELVRRTLHDYAPVFQQSGIELETDLPGRPTWAIVDVTRIAQVVGNLLQNAAKFTPAGGKVRLTLSAGEGCAEIRVADTGAGIAPELLPGLFEPFMQGKQSLARTEGGLGLGLALVKGIVELHRGSVRAESEGPGKGATFVVHLPLLGEGTVRAPAAPEPARSQQSRRVLVVDDNSDAADTLAQLVTMFGHTAEVAYDGATALAKVRANPPDVVLCDLGLPGMTGYDVARRLRAEGGRTRLIAVSGYAQPEDIAGAREAGFEQHLAKPIDPDVVRSLLA